MTASSNFTMDLGIDIGNNLDQENTYFKLKIGRGSSEILTLKQIVENGTGKPLGEELMVSICVPDGCEFEDQKAMAEDFVQFEQTDKDNETWLQFNLANSTFWEEGMSEKVNSAFEKVKDNAHFEFRISSAKTLTDALQQSKDSQEVENKKAPSGKLPSFATFLDSFSAHIKCDIEHAFIESAQEFLKDMGAPVKSELFPQIQKANNLVAEFRFKSANELPQHELQVWSEQMMSHFEDIQGGIGMALMGASIAKDVKVYFLFKDNAYATLDINIPGLVEYCTHMGEE